MTEATITSPVGIIGFLAVKNKVRKKPQDIEPSVYTVRIEFDGNTAEGAAFRQQIASINEGLIGTTHVSQEGNYTVAASSKFVPKVMDSDGNLLDAADLPHFTKGSTGTASMVVKPFLGNPLGGALNLIAIGIKSLDIADQVVEDSYLDALRAQLNS